MQLHAACTPSHHAHPDVEASKLHVRLTRCPGWLSACMRVLMVSTGYMAVCSTMPAIEPAIMCCIGFKCCGEQLAQGWGGWCVQTQVGAARLVATLPSCCQERLPSLMLTAAGCSLSRGKQTRRPPWTLTETKVKPSYEVEASLAGTWTAPACRCCSALSAGAMAAAAAARSCSPEFAAAAGIREAAAATAAAAVGLSITLAGVGARLLENRSCCSRSFQLLIRPRTAGRLGQEGCWLAGGRLQRGHRNDLLFSSQKTTALNEQDA
jgi:hypothetical protein